MERISVYTSDCATDAEIGRVSSALAEVEVSSSTQRIIPSQGVGEVVLFVIGVPVTSFLTSFSAEAGREAWRKLKVFRDSLDSPAQPKRKWRFWRRRNPESEIQVLVRPEIQFESGLETAEKAAKLLGWIPSGDSSSELTIPAGLPDEAYKKLFSLDLKGFDHHRISWNPDVNEWEVHAKEQPNQDAAG